MKEYNFPGQTGFYRGKVRDVYYINEDKLLMIASDRISAFDVILPEPIPYKGQILTQIAAYMLEECQDICPIWLKGTPAANASLGLVCKPLKAEIVVRRYLTGHAWRTYLSGKRELCGVTLPSELKENDPFPEPIITPSTKADEGHDEDISKEQILETGIMTAGEWDQISGYALKLFKRGADIAAKIGLILVDTKYEFGKIGNEIFLMDEIHTPDSSRFFYADQYAETQMNGMRQKQLSKEFVREWLIENNFMGREGDVLPVMSAQWVNKISLKYIELYEKIIGEKFLPQQFSDEEIFENCKNALALL